MNCYILSHYNPLTSHLISQPRTLNDFFLSEPFWVAVGSLMTATALVYTIIKSWVERKESINNIKEALYFELVTNIEMLFSGEVERRPLDEANKAVREKFLKYIKDQEKLLRIQKLYSELDYYKTFVDNVYLNPNISFNGAAVTEKQLSTINKFLEFFGQRTITKKPTESWDQARDRGIEKKKKFFNKWKNILCKETDSLF